ncbi:hypothetical protein GTU99_13065 [Streptomyces sp. PRKS01-65]|nr:thiol-activated cytolysin family protein [Streptomyces harenosi]NEY33110.1 hypothetical protein [Streptomyces harenosi]
MTDTRTEASTEPGQHTARALLDDKKNWRVRWSPAERGDQYLLVQRDADGRVVVDALHVKSRSTTIKDLRLPYREKPQQHAVLAFRDGHLVDGSFLLKPSTDTSSGPVQTQPDTADVQSTGSRTLNWYVKQWKSWDSIAPQDAPKKQAEGEPRREKDQDWYKVAQTYLLVNRPTLRVTLRDSGAIWPGAIVQGTYALKGELVPAGIVADKRAPLSLTVSAPTADQIPPVEYPDLNKVDAAIKKSVKDKKSSSTDIDFRYKAAFDSTATALEMGCSAKFGGLGADIKLQLSTEYKRNTVAVMLYERAYSAHVYLDGNANSLVNSTCTDEYIKTLISDQKMGDGNPPLIISDVTYGRILMFTMICATEIKNIQQAVQASYEGFKGLSLEEKKGRKSVIESSEIRMISRGVEKETVKKYLEEGKIAEFFTGGHDLGNYKIVGFTLKTLDGREALMSEDVRYDEVIWSRKGSDPRIRDVTIRVGNSRRWGWAECSNVWVKIDGLKTWAVGDWHKAEGTRDFDADFKGDPFKVVLELAGFQNRSVDFSPKDKGWFEGGVRYHSDWQWVDNTIDVYVEAQALH